MPFPWGMHQRSSCAAANAVEHRKRRNYAAVVETCYQFRGRFPGHLLGRHLLGKFAAVAAGQVHFVEATALTAEDLATVRQQERARVAALRR